jgi:50S ribosomal subunit-associated GTPase HflX
MEIVTITSYIFLLILLLSSVIIFLYIILNTRKRKIREFYSIPSILITGSSKSGKTQLLKTITQNNPINYPFMDSIMVNYLQFKDKLVRFLEVPLNKEKMEEIKKLNLIGIVFSFDATKTIKEQYELYKSLRRLNKKMIVVANKCDIGDKGKINSFKKRFPNIILVSALDGKGIYELRKRIFSEFLSSFKS